jgi:hypothetical protein
LGMDQEEIRMIFRDNIAGLLYPEDR